MKIEVSLWSRYSSALANTFFKSSAPVNVLKNGKTFVLTPSTVPNCSRHSCKVGVTNLRRCHKLEKVPQTGEGATNWGRCHKLGKVPQTGEGATNWRKCHISAFSTLYTLAFIARVLSPLTSLHDTEVITLLLWTKATVLKLKTFPFLVSHTLQQWHFLLAF
jgi:hypothetical protein